MWAVRPNEEIDLPCKGPLQNGGCSDPNPCVAGVRSGPSSEQFASTSGGGTRGPRPGSDGRGASAPMPRPRHPPGAVAGPHRVGAPPAPAPPHEGGFGGVPMQHPHCDRWPLPIRRGGGGASFAPRRAVPLGADVGGWAPAVEGWGMTLGVGGPCRPRGRGTGQAEVKRCSSPSLLGGGGGVPRGGGGGGVAFTGGGGPVVCGEAALPWG